MYFLTKLFLAELLQSSWSPYTELLPVLENIFTNERPNVAFLKRILRAAKPHLLNVFKNPVCFIYFTLLYIFNLHTIKTN